MIQNTPSGIHRGECYTSAVRRSGAVTAAIVLTFSVLCTANDTLATLGAGGLVPVRSSEIVMESEDLEVSTHKIVVRYTFRNDSTKDIDAVVAFPLPDLAGGSLYYDPINLPYQDDPNFVGFEVTSGGKRIETSLQTRALLTRERDITERLHSVGLPPSVLLEPLNYALLKLSPEQRGQLEKDELIVPGEFNPPLRSAGNKGWWASWAMRSQFYWTQHFPANSTVELLQSYSPVVGGSYITANYDGSESIRPYCGGPDELHRVVSIKRNHHRKGDSDIDLFERRIDYVLTTANNWNGPIGHFRLSVVTGPDDILVTCMPGLKQVNPTRYEMVRSNFRPDRDLKLLILQENK